MIKINQSEHWWKYRDCEHEGITPPKWSLFLQSLQGRGAKTVAKFVQIRPHISSRLRPNQCCKEIDLTILLPFMVQNEASNSIAKT